MEDEGGAGIPEAWKAGAEEVRHHLVSLRGGALFLSPADALQLVQWFEQGVEVGAILRALERACEARRKSRSRVPLGLRQARRHLGKPSPGALSARVVRSLAPMSGAGPLGPLVAVIRERAQADRHADLMRALADHLAQIEPADADLVVRQALAAIRGFRDAVWDATGEVARQEARDRALEELGDLVGALDEHTAMALVEEEAREAVRAGYAWLSAATVWDVVEEVARG